MLGHVAQPLAKHLGEGGFGHGGRFLQAHGRVKLARAMVGHRIGLGLVVALAFFGHHVQKLRAGQVADVLQRGDQRIEIVAVDGANVVKAKLLKQRRRHHHAFGVFFDALGQLKQGGRALEHAFAHAFGLGIKLPAHQLGQVAVERAHGRADAHFVVVQDDQQAAVFHAGVVQRLKRHAGGERSVANDGHRIAVVAFDLGGHGHA